MPGAAWLSVGNELLSGRTRDTNAAFGASFLDAAGFPLVAIETTSDDPELIADSITRLRARASVVVVSGGIGPTPDDLTRHGLARALGVGLVENAQARAWLEAFFAKTGREVGDRNRIQIMLPAGCDAVRNPRGTACGMLHRDREGGLILVVPGVPQEMRAILETELGPRLKDHPERGPAPTVAKVTLAGIAESKVGAELHDLMARGRDPEVGCYPRISGQVLVLRTRATGAEGEARLAADIATIQDRMGSVVIAPAEVELGEVVVAALLRRGLSLSVAESLTGGRASDLIVSVPGASDVFLAGFVTYANSAKVELLGVASETLEAHGAVSRECALQMAAGARERSGSDLAVSLTGIAGPAGGSEEKPVGTVWFGLADGDRVQAFHRVIPGGRAEVQERAAHVALDLVRRWLLGCLPPESA